MQDISRRLGVRIAVLVALAAVAVGAAAPAHAIPPPIFDFYGGTAWGSNFRAQLGDRTFTDRLSPIQVYGLTSGARQVAAGIEHSMVLKSDGSVWAWGDNTWGQIGNGTNFPYGQPERVYGLTNVVQIAAGGTTSMALKSDGTVWTWGANFSGKLGDGTTTHRNAPVQVAGLTGVTKIAAGGMHNLALRSDGTVWAWGDSTRGQLGGDNWYYRYTAAPVPNLSNVVQIAAGFRHNVVLLGDGSVRTWGDNYHGQLGVGGGQIAHGQPQTPFGLPSITRIAAGWRHSFACSSNGGGDCRYGSLFAWGDNSAGQLGDRTRITRTTPVLITYVSGVKEMYGGFAHSVLVVYTPSGTRHVYAVGNNTVGQLGDGTRTERSEYRRVGSLENPLHVAAGDNHTVAVVWQPGVICCA